LIFQFFLTVCDNVHLYTYSQAEAIMTIYSKYRKYSRISRSRV